MKQDFEKINDLCERMFITEEMYNNNKDDFLLKIRNIYYYLLTKNYDAPLDYLRTFIDTKRIKFYRKIYKPLTSDEIEYDCAVCGEITKYDYIEDEKTGEYLCMNCYNQYKVLVEADKEVEYDQRMNEIW